MKINKKRISGKKNRNISALDIVKNNLFLYQYF